MDKPVSRTVGFCGQYVTIHSYGSQAISLVDFLCSDLSAGTSELPRTVYDLLVVGKKPMLSLWEGEKQLYFGECWYRLAYTLINEIIYQCLAENSAGHAIHAAAICFEDKAILLPGTSGSGKSTLAAWLLNNGCTYLTDELVVISMPEKRIHPFTRPISIKAGSRSVISSFLNFDPLKVVAGEDGLMLPHRLVNSDYQVSTPPLSLILFPEYKSGTINTITRLSGAQGCLKLIECYVNGRNIQGHGFGSLAELARSTPTYQLTYGNFNGLKSMIYELFSKNGLADRIL